MKREKRHLHNCDVNPHEDSQFLVKQFIHTLHYKTDMNYTFSDHDMTSIWWQKIEIINTFYHSEKKIIFCGFVFQASDIWVKNLK